jgi:hypothetical protein
MGKYCGKCGKELRCLKTGHSIKFDWDHESIVHQGDLYGCLKCDTIFSFVNENGYECNYQPDCVINKGEARYSEKLFEMWDNYYEDWEMRDRLKRQKD